MTSAVRSFGLSLPDYPWEAMAPYLARAAEHPGGAVNLSIGTPVDPTPALVQEALQAAADAPGYPTVHGTPALREAIAGVVRPPPRRSRAGPAERHAHGRFQGTRGVAAVPARDSSRATSSSVPRLRTPPTTSGRRSPAPSRSPRTTSTNWTTTPAPACPAGLGQLAGQPHRKRPGRRIPEAHRGPGPRTRRRRGIRRVLRRTRLGRMGRPARRPARCPASWIRALPSGSHEGLLAVYSLSKQSNLAGYRAAFVAGDPAHHGQPGEQPQARRHDRALPGPGSHAGGAGRRRPRPGAEGPVPRPAGTDRAGAARRSG